MRKLLHTLWSISKLQVFSINYESFLDLSILCPKVADQFCTCLFLFFSLKTSRLLMLCTSGNKMYEVSVVYDNNDWSNTGCKRLFCFPFCVGHTKLTEPSTSQFLVAVKSMSGNSQMLQRKFLWGGLTAVDLCILNVSLVTWLDHIPIQLFCQ